MEKIYIKPVSREIIVRGKEDDGHLDAFSYNYEGNATNGLGSLFIVGQVHPATEDTSYMINLVASLAKREYYVKDHDAPKEAFSRTLKKINEVLQDFFRNKELKINIGVFAVAGENIYISRLGKFKIILGRDGQTIDVLNNINLFSKEHIQEKEFSNIISGKIATDDKILAFYPSRAMTAREKNIKAQLIKSDVNEFSATLNDFKKANDSFSCAAVHIVINKFKESAVVKNPQPQELAEPKTMLTKAPKVTADELPTAEQILGINPTLSKEEPAIKIQPTPENKPKDSNPQGNVYYPGNKNSDSNSSPLPQETQPENYIRPTEFSAGKKSNLFDSIFKKLKPSGVYVIGSGQGPVFSKKKIILSSSIIAVIVLAVIAKFTFAPYLPIPIPGTVTPEEKAANGFATEAQAGLDSAKTHINQNNLYEARKILKSYFESLEAQTIKTEQLNKIEGDILATLDQIDKAITSSPSLLQEVLTKPEGDYQVWSVVWSLATGEISSEKPDLASIEYYPYQNNLYILAPDGIFKINDGLKSKGNPVAWLNKNVTLPENPISMAIDGKVFIISERGVLTTYYKGDKVAEVNTSIPVEKGSALLTTQDSAFLYLLDKSLGRVYVLTKEAGSLVKTLKIGSEQPIVDASMGTDETIYLLSSDNKVWKVTP